MIKQLSYSAIAATVGAGMGYGLSAYMKHQSQAAVNVRPKLADVGWVDALLTNHLGDWIFYNHPDPATYALTFLGAAILGIWIFIIQGDLRLQD